MADLVSVDWLANNLDHPHVKLLDCTWSMPGENLPSPYKYIPRSQFFDIDKIADLQSAMKHMLPSASTFSRAVSDMNISNADHVICYDKHGIRSSPRVWWTFKTFGHKLISVLDGGLPSWIKFGQELSDKIYIPHKKSDFKINTALLKVAELDFVKEKIGTDYQIVDARSSGRFFGTIPEPRSGLRSGRIPGSYSLPFTELKNTDGTFLPLIELASRVGKAGISLEKPIITSCGSGVTAAGIAHVLFRLGAKDITLYDGSWTDWGATHLPVEI